MTTTIKLGPGELSFQLADGSLRSVARFESLELLPPSNPENHDAHVRDWMLREACTIRFTIP